MESVSKFLNSTDATELIDQIENLLYHNKKVVIGGVSFLLSLYCWYRRPINFPPGPVGVPGLGVVPFLDKMAARSFTEWGKKYKKGVMSVRLGGNDLVIINRADVIKKVLYGNRIFFIILQLLTKINIILIFSNTFKTIYLLEKI